MLQFAFSSAKKKMFTIMKHPQFNNQYRVLVKGASEMVLETCSKMMKQNSNPEMFFPILIG